MDHLLARYLEILPLVFELALPIIKLEWNINPYFGVLPCVFNAQEWNTTIENVVTTFLWCYVQAADSPLVHISSINIWEPMLYHPHASYKKKIALQHAMLSFTSFFFNSSTICIVSLVKNPPHPFCIITPSFSSSQPLCSSSIWTH